MRHPSPSQAARFLMQATLGPTPAEIARVTEIGFEAWLDEQFQLEPSLTHVEVYQARAAGLHFEMHHAWWRQVLTAPDVLRHRLAVALSEIFIVSEVAIEFVPRQVGKLWVGALTPLEYRSFLISDGLLRRPSRNDKPQKYSGTPPT